MKFEFDWPSSFRGDVARVIGILLAHLGAFPSGELKMILKKSADDIGVNLPYINWHMFLLLSHSYMVLYTVIKNKNVFRKIKQ